MILRALSRRSDSVGDVDACFSFEVIDRVVLDNGHTYFERADPSPGQFESEHPIKWKKEAPWDYE